MDPCDQVPLRKGSENFVYAAIPQARYLYYKNSGDNLVVLGTHLCLDSSVNGVYRRAVEGETYGCKYPELIRSDVSQIGSIELHGRISLRLGVLFVVYPSI